jgi:hypothetical protein
VKRKPKRTRRTSRNPSSCRTKIESACRLIRNFANSEEHRNFSRLSTYIYSLTYVNDSEILWNGVNLNVCFFSQALNIKAAGIAQCCSLRSLNSSDEKGKQ